MDAKELREKNKAKARRLAGNGDGKVPGSTTWTPDEPMNTDVKTGARPLSKRAFKRGGKVEGETAKHHAGRPQRKNGGKTDNIGNAIINRNVKEANEERPGKKHVGGWKKGGKVGKLGGGGLYGMETVPTNSTVPTDGKAAKNSPGNGLFKRNLVGVTQNIQNMSPRDFNAKYDNGDPVYNVTGRRYGPHDDLGTAVMNAPPVKKAPAAPVPTGGKVPLPAKRAARQDGGRTKGKTNINIIIAPQAAKAEPTAPAPVSDMPMPPPPMDMPKVGAGAPMGMPPGPPAGLAAALQEGALPRKNGGRTIKMKYGAGSGLGRLEKIEKYGDNA